MDLDASAFGCIDCSVFGFKVALMISYQSKIVPGTLSEADINLLGLDGWEIASVINVMGKQFHYFKRASRWAIGDTAWLLTVTGKGKAITPVNVPCVVHAIVGGVASIQVKVTEAAGVHSVGDTYNVGYSSLLPISDK